jgi:3-isopropylmalate dehydrogenase
MNYNIAVIKGDGIGPEVTEQAMLVLDAVGQKYGHTFHYTNVLMGGCAIDATGVPLPQETIDICLKSDSVLLGAVGGPKWDNLKGDLRPEAGLLGIRKALGLYANIRPAVLFPSLSGACPLRADIAAKGIDMVVIRELTGGIYFGERGYREGKYGLEAFDSDCYSEFEVRRIAKTAFETAMKRGKKVTSIDKANVLENSRLWRKVVHEVAAEYPEVTVKDMLVDNAAMQLVKNPAQFDVVLANNMFGDILSDEAAMITGSIGILASASLGDSGPGLYEPIHGSAPDIAGQNKANPIATILSVAMMLKYSLNLENECKAIEDAVAKVLNDGYRTLDIAEKDAKILTTTEMGKMIAEGI